MRSRAHVKTHPLHPILVGFPISFFTATLVFDLLGYFKEDASWHTQATSLLIAGITMAVVAAIPGLIDFIYTVPPDSSAKKTRLLTCLSQFVHACTFHDSIGVQGD